MQTYEVISVRKSGQSMFVNVKLDGVKLDPSPSCHSRFSKKAYDAIDADNLQAGDTIKLSTKESGNGYVNIVEYGGKVSGSASGASTPPAGSGAAKGNSNFRHPDEITMTESLTLSRDLVVSLISADKGGFKKTETLENIKNTVIDLAYEFYVIIKDPSKNMALESDSADVSSTSPEPEQKPLPDTKDVGEE